MIEPLVQYLDVRFLLPLQGLLQLGHQLIDDFGSDATGAAFHLVDDLGGVRKAVFFYRTRQVFQGVEILLPVLGEHLQV